MDVLVLIDKLDDTIHNAKPVPLTDQVRVDKEEIYDILDQMRATIPEEIKQARWIVKERQEMLAEAKREAERIVKEAREQQARLVANEEITRRFIRAYSEAICFLKANKTATMRAIQKYARIKDPKILELTYNEARTHIEWPPYVSKRGVESILTELAPTEPKAKSAKPDDFYDHRYVTQLEKDGFFKAAK